jgi:acetate kinase
MNVVTISCGSSGLKVRLCIVDADSLSILADGAVERIGADASIGRAMSREGANGPNGI